MHLTTLTPDQLVKPRHFELRLSVMFAALFVSAGVHLPYFPLWLEGVGFSAGDIAIILSAPMFLRMATTPFITALADRAGDRVHVLLVLIVASLILSAGYFLEPRYAVVLAISIMLAIVWTPQAPIVDSVALSGVRRYKSDYSRMRVWGSFAFLVSSVGGGIVLSATGADAVPTLIVAGFCVTLAATVIVPRLGRPRVASPLSATDLQAAPSILTRRFVLFVAAAGVITGSHGFLYGFISIYWKSTGLDESTVGALWAWSVTAEVLMFFAFTRLLGGASAERLIAYAGAGAALRWLALPLIEPLGLGIPGYFAVQTLHALSTGLILIGVQKMIAEVVPEHRTGAAQGIAFLANGLSMATVTLAAGPLYERMGVDGFHVMVAVALAGLVLVAFSARSSAPEGGDGR